MVKVNQLKGGFEEFQQKVAEAMPELVKIAGADTVIKQSFTDNAKYDTKTAISFTKKLLAKAKSDASATEETVIIIGGFEVGDKGTGPVSYGILKGGKKGAIRKAWRGEVDTGTKKIRIPTFAMAKLMVQEEVDDYGPTTWIKNVLGKKDMELNQIIEKLAEWNAILSQDDVAKLIKTTTPQPVVAMRCTLAGASNMSKFGTDIAYNVWHSTSKDGKVIAEGPMVSLRTRKSNNDVVAWIRVNPSKAGIIGPSIQIEDFEEICRDVTERFDNQKDQATFLGSAMEDREILAIGAITSIKEKDDGSTQINMNAILLMEADMDSQPVLMGQQPLVEPEKPIEDAPEIEEVVASPAAKPVTKPAMKPDAPEAPPKPVKPVKDPVVEPVPEHIKEVIELTKTIANLTEDTDKKAALENMVNELETEPNNEDIQMDVDAEETEPEPATEESESVLCELTPELNQVAEKLMMAASLARGVRATGARSEKIAALKTFTLDDAAKFKLMSKYGKDVVEQVYNYLINEPQ